MKMLASKEANASSQASQSYRCCRSSRTQSSCEWGRANGRVLVGNEAAARCPVEAAMDHLTPPDVLYFKLVFEARTDGMGYFSFSRVPVGSVSVYRPHRFADGELVRSQLTEITVRP